MIEDMLNQAAENMQSEENLSIESLRAYNAMVEQFERQGYDLTKYREIGEELRKRIEARERDKVEKERAAMPGYLKAYEWLKKTLFKRVI